MKRLTIAGALAALVLAGCSQPFVTAQVASGQLHRAPPDFKGLCPECGQLALDVAWSLQNEPQAWSGDSYNLCKGAVDTTCLWIANRDYGLTVKRGLTGPAALEGDMYVPDREFIWRTYGKWAIRNLDK